MDWNELIFHHCISIWDHRRCKWLMQHWEIHRLASRHRYVLRMIIVMDRQSIHIRIDGDRKVLRIPDKGNSLWDAKIPEMSSVQFDMVFAVNQLMDRFHCPHGYWRRGLRDVLLNSSWHLLDPDSCLYRRRLLALSWSEMFPVSNSTPIVFDTSSVVLGTRDSTNDTDCCTVPDTEPWPMVTEASCEWSFQSGY